MFGSLSKAFVWRGFQIPEHEESTIKKITSGSANSFVFIGLTGENIKNSVDTGHLQNKLAPGTFHCIVIICVLPIETHNAP